MLLIGMTTIQEHLECRTQQLRRQPMIMMTTTMMMTTTTLAMTKWTTIILTTAKTLAAKMKLLSNAKRWENACRAKGTRRICTLQTYAAKRGEGKKCYAPKQKRALLLSSAPLRDINHAHELQSMSSSDSFSLRSFVS